MNEVFHRNPKDGYYLSYAGSPGDDSTYVQLFDAMFVSEANRGRDETAICIKDPWKCLILYGDHREAYKPIADDFEACKKYFQDNSSLMGETSDTLH